LFTDPSAAARDNFPFLDRAGSTLTDVSNDADELIELVESGETEQPAKRKTLQTAIETFNKFGISTPPVFSCALQL
jgi:hypothetical protein